MSEHLQVNLFESLAGELTPLSAASPAKTSVLPEKAKDSAVRDPASIGKYIALQWRYDRLGYSLRMCLLSALEAATTFSCRWQKQNTLLGLLWWVLTTSEQAIGESESGLWGTPRASEGMGRYGITNGKRYEKLYGQVLNYWRSPTAEEAGARVETLFTKDGEPATTGHRAFRKQPDGRMVLQSVTLNQQVEMWPTPATRDWKDIGTEPSAQGRHSPALPASVVINGHPDPDSLSTNGKSRERLNPKWVAQLMGFPSDWLDGIE